MKKSIYLFCSVLFLCFFLACGKERGNQPPQNQNETDLETVHVKEGTGNIIQFQTDFGNTIIVQFSKKIGETGDVKKKISLSPEVKVDAVIIDEDKLLLTGDFNSEKVYQLNLSKLTGDEKDAIRVSFRQKPAQLEFEDGGMILPGQDKSLSIKMVNVREVTIDIYKIYPNNMNTFVNSLDFSEGPNYYYNFNERLEEMGELVFQERHEISFQKNKNSYLKLDLNKVLQKNGIYAVRLEGTGLEDGYQPPEIKKVLILSNVGIFVQKFPEEIQVQLVNIQTRQALSGAKVFLMSRNNQILEETTSNAEGKTSFKNSLDKAYYIKTVYGTDINVLKLTEALPLESFDVSGVEVFDKNQIYLYTDRPEYRPGETIHANIVVRRDRKALPKGHPITVAWIDANGVGEKESLAWNENSFYALKKEIPKKANTGIWGLQVKVGDSSQYLEIPVETNIAKKLESKLEVPAQESAEIGKKYKISLQSNYLYGDPSPDQKVQLFARVVADKQKFLNYENFSFDLPNAPEIKEIPFQIDLKNGKGSAELSLFEKEADLPTSWNANIYWEAQVLDENSRPNLSYATTKLEKFKTFVGIENYKGKYFVLGEEQKIPVVVLDTKGKRVAGRNLQYTIYQKSSLFWYDFYPNDEHLSLKNDKAAKKVKEGKITTSSKLSYITVPSLDEGTIYIEVEDLETHQVAGTSYRLSYWKEGGKFQHISKLRMSSDKDKYKVGDVATILWEAAENSKAYVTLEKNGKVFKSFTLTPQGKDGKIEFPITQDMVPNVYVNVVLLQDYEKYTNDRPARLYGVLPIIVEDDVHDVGVKVEVPNEVESKDKLIVKVSNEKKKQMDYVVSVVDMGLLQRKNYKDPNPHSYFFAKRAYTAMLYDNYTILLPKNQRREDIIMTVGGGDYEGVQAPNLLMAKEAIESKALGIEEADRFQNLALYQGIIQSDREGKLQVSFDLPRYQGAIKVIVTAVKDDYYGATSRKVLVKAPVIMQNSAPRTLKIGDEFVVSSRLVQKNPKITKGKWTVSFAGKKKEVEVDFHKKKEYFLEETFQAPKKIGVEEILISFASDSYQDEEKIAIDVNTTNSYTYLEEAKQLKPGETYKNSLPKEVLSGSDSMKLAVSTVKRYGIDRKLQELIRYPYGCSEQITSAAMAQLYIKQLETVSLFPEEIIQKNINATISSLREYQTQQGISYWPSSYVESPFTWLDNYIGEFIIRAKEEGYYVNAGFYDRVLANLQRTSIQNEDIEEKIYALWILSSVQKAYVAELNYVRESLYENLDLTQKWLLLSAYARQGEVDFAKTKAKSLMIWDEKKPTRELALRMEAYRSIFGKIEAKDEEKLLNLLGKLDSYDTYSVARVLMALVQEKKKGAEASFVLNGKEEKTSSGLYRKDYDKGEAISLQNKSNQTLYVYSFWEGKTLDRVQKAEEKGIHLERTEFSKKAKEGEVVSWTLSVAQSKKSSVNHLDKFAVVEVLPSGWEWEVSREDLANISAEYIDIRDDRILFIFPGLLADKIEIPLKARAITRGKYIFPGSLAEEMYHSDVRGQLSNETVEVGS